MSAIASGTCPVVCECGHAEREHSPGVCHIAWCTCDMAGGFRRAWRYTYLGDVLTDPALVGQRCDGVRRPDGKFIVSNRMATQLVEFADGSRRVVKRRRLRLILPARVA